jgi:hypothetical protein
MTYNVSNKVDDRVVTQAAGREGRREERLLQQRWHGWGSPVGLGLGLLSVGGFFALLAVGLSVLASIGQG